MLRRSASKSATARRRSGVLDDPADGRKVVLHVGCGPPDPEKVHERFRGSAWREVRLDIDPSVDPDILGSIVSMPAIPAEAVDAVWSSHNLEHVYAHEVPVVLREFFRVLRPAGVVLITVPDLQHVAKSIAKGQLEETLYMSPAGPITPLDMLYGHRSSIQQGNEYMAHHTGFTARTLANKLEQTGFMEVAVKTPGDRAVWAMARKPSRRAQQIG